MKPAPFSYVRPTSLGEALAALLRDPRFSTNPALLSLPALIGHVEIVDLERWPDILHAIKAMLLDKHGIDHITLQAEVARPTTSQRERITLSAYVEQSWLVQKSKRCRPACAASIR